MSAPGGGADWRACRYDERARGGHYESWFLRANHPVRSQAFWVRYTIFSPAGRPEDAQGELWAIYFDGESGAVHAARSEVALGECHFARTGLDVRIGASQLNAEHFRGEIGGPPRLGWDLSYGGGGAPIRLLPEAMYGPRLPNAKSVTTQPFAVFNGTFRVGDAVVEVRDWIGSENHNWGRRHTDRYAWAQVVGFDDAPDAFLEVITARLKVGPLSAPPLTLLVLNAGGREYRFNSLSDAFKARGRWEGLAYEFASTQGGVRISGRISAPAESFVGLTYRNPPGGEKIVLNTKIGACDIEIEQPDGSVRRLRTRNRAALEILGDETVAGLPIIA